MLTRKKWAGVTGWLGTALAASMYISFAEQIWANLNGHRGAIILPTIAVLSSIAWTAHGFLLSPRNLPLIMCNSIGVVMALLTVLTWIVG